MSGLATRMNRRNDRHGGALPNGRIGGRFLPGWFWIQQGNKLPVPLCQQSGLLT
jgi:hypothetical protein